MLRLDEGTLGFNDMNVRNEIWKPVFGYEGFYEVSSFGRVRTVLGASQHSYHYHAGSILGPSNDGHYWILHLTGLKKRTRRVHTLVLESFIGPRPKGMVSRHLDGNAYNNALENLAWGTQKQNMDDKKKHGTNVEGTGCWQAKLTEDDVVKIRELRKSGETLDAISKMFPVTPNNIWDVTSGRTWKHVPA